MMDFRLFVILATLLTACVHVTHGLASSACYGTDPSCDFYTMQCASQQVIRVRNLYAGYKNTTLYPICGTEQHCSSSSICCALGGTEIREDFNLENTYNTYTNCSGRQSCTAIHAPWQQLQTTVNGFTIYSSFVHLEYDCQEVSSKIPLCGGTSTTSYAEIMFDGSMENFDPLKASKECRCNVTNFGEQQNVILTTIDVRLESHYKRENQTSADCSSASFTSNVRSVKCVKSDMHYEDNFFYESSDDSQQTLIMAPWMTSDIRLTDIHANGARDSPAMVWISLKAEEGKAFSITCEEVIPAQFTTTTTSSTTSTTTTTTTTTPKPTTTTTTTTPKPTTTTTTTTPKPTTTTTTTTPKPTTTTTTTPKPTTTTTTTTPKPTTTTTTTTPKLTTTTTTTTPKLTTTTTTTTPKPKTTTTTTTTKTTTQKQTTTTTTVTPKPTTTTTTPTPTTKRTTPKPTTTTTTTTTKLSTATTTLKPTAPPTAKTNKPTTTTTTEKTVTISTSPPFVPSGDGESDKKQHTAVYLAIIIPIIVCLFFITALLLWIYWKRTTPRRKKFHFMKSTPRSEVYNTFSNPKILDDFIKDVGVESRSSVTGEKPPISTFISVPNPQKRPRSILSNGSTYRQQQAPEPYIIPVNVTNGDPLYTTPRKQPFQNGVHVRINQGENVKDNPVIITETVEPETRPLKEVESQPNESDQRQSTLRKKPDDDGGILIHVDNLSLPPVSARSTSADSSRNTSSTRSEIGSTPGNLTPERRNSEPAVITPDSIVDRRSASAYILPGSSPDDSSVLFVP
ncbi:uncharacterized protein LOC123554394 isoform X1 [Mercenaria mercenaria]|uniref:uncharacterized protein LOC123554394 isoform X1 n=1 Tax=Mercenaria mercenaria TaxID=6596 RepID=UPI00234F31D5|nr:uncharacterized protein LOC123554394 isoform X1 [Mercenaria mercenaria]